MKKDEGKKKKAAKSMDQMETQAYDIQGRFVGPITGFLSRPFRAGDLDDLLQEFEDTIPEAVWIQSLMPPCIWSPRTTTIRYWDPSPVAL